MRLHARGGDRRHAIVQYERCREIIAREFDANPEAATIALHDEITSGAFERADSPEPPREASLTNVPYSVTTFVGREREARDVADLLDRGRLVTLTGMAGIGKTRLALHVGRGVVERFSHGVWFVDFAPLDNPRLVAKTIATALGIPPRPDLSPIAALVEFAAAGPMLLLLDTCERVGAAVAEVVAELLGACADLSVLATSREALGVVGEAVLTVPPLDLPQPDASPESTYAATAVRLFVERGRLSAPTETLGDREASTVAAICRRLDGIPLAIELAAARLAFLTINQVFGRLDDRFRFLSSEARTVEARHRNLRAVVDWSYDLLDGTESALFRRLSIFSGGWTLAAAEDICSGDGASDPYVLDLLGRLVARSLVVVVRAARENRYRFLDTIREYAATRLVEAGEREEIASRHARWCIAEAEAAELQRTIDGGTAWLDRLEADHDNFRVALAWTIGDERDAELGLRLCLRLHRFWCYRGYEAEAKRWYDAALASPIPSQLRAQATFDLGRLGEYQGDYLAARVRYAESLVLERELGWPEKIARTLMALAWTEGHLGHSEMAISLGEEALALHRSLGDTTNAAKDLYRLGTITLTNGNLDIADRYLNEAADVLERDVESTTLAGVLTNIALLEHHRGNLDRADTIYERAHEISVRFGDEINSATVLGGRALIANDRGNRARARTWMAEALEIYRRHGDKMGFVWALEDSACLAATNGNGARALRLVGAAAALRTGLHLPRQVIEREKLDRYLGPHRAALGETAVERSLADGATMTLDDALDLALTG